MTHHATPLPDRINYVETKIAYLFIYAYFYGIIDKFTNGQWMLEYFLIKMGRILHRKIKKYSLVIMYGQFITVTWT